MIVEHSIAHCIALQNAECSSQKFMMGVWILMIMYFGNNLLNVIFVTNGKCSISTLKIFFF